MKYRVRELTNGRFIAERKRKFWFWASCWFENIKGTVIWKEIIYNTKPEAEKSIEKYVKEKKYEKNPNIYPYELK